MDEGTDSDVGQRMSIEVSRPFSPDLTPILETVLDAVVVMSEDGLVLAWNAVAETTFGWTAEETLGRPLADSLIPEQHREAHDEGLRRLVAGGKARVLNRRIEISALCKDGREVPVELSITTTLSDHGRCFVGFLRDISERRDAEERLHQQALEARLTFEITQMASESDSFDAALESALSAICEITGWPVGHALVVAPSDSRLLLSTSIWVETSLDAASELKRATAETRFSAGVGLPGRILASGEPLWVSDMDHASDFPRKGTGFRGAFGFPLKNEGKVIAVLEFFTESPIAPDPALLLTVRTLGEQVGRVFERKRTHDRQQLLMNELNHRVKNILAVVQAVAHRSLTGVADPQQGYDAFMSRLMALAGAQDLLVAQDWSGASLRKIVDTAMTGCGSDDKRVTVSGPDIEVPASSAISISLAVHELCTNAFKYGALSVDGGHVQITWGPDPGRADGQFFFEWRESGGPPVSPPSRKGFGTSLIQRGIARELGGRAEIDYAPTGLVCRFTASGQSHP
jgi:PAS domain S-box-containing protein